MLSYKNIILAALLSSAGTGAALADTTLVNDTFASGTNPGWVTNDNSIANSGTGGATVTVVTTGTGLDGNALQFTNTSNNRAMSRTFALTSLAVGDEIELSMDFRFSTTPVSVSQGFIMGLFNSSLEEGVRVGVNPAGATGAAGRTVYFGTDFAATNIGSSYVTSDLGTTAHSATVTITRTSATTLDITSNLSGASITRTATLSELFGFDTIFVGMSGSGNQGAFFVDDVLITTTVTAVPEPSAAAAMAGLVVVGIAVLRRRARLSRV